MELIYPTAKNNTFQNLKELPSMRGGGSNYFMLSTVKSGLDMYICFCNAERDKVYIEKTTYLNPNRYLCMEDLTFVENEEEFKRIHNFLIEKGILDG